MTRRIRTTRQARNARFIAARSMCAKSWYRDQTARFAAGLEGEILTMDDLNERAQAFLDKRAEMKRGNS